MFIFYVTIQFLYIHGTVLVFLCRFICFFSLGERRQWHCYITSTQIHLRYSNSRNENYLKILHNICHSLVWLLRFLCYNKFSLSKIIKFCSFLFFVVSWSSLWHFCMWTSAPSRSCSSCANMLSEKYFVCKYEWKC